MHRIGWCERSPFFIEKDPVMLNNRKQSSASFVRRKRQVRRLLLETLERRECPAVMFGFERGILSITGDEGPNAIEIIQRDRAVEVVGDGERRTFEGVNLVSVETGDGDDTVGWTGGVTVAGGDVEHSVRIDVGDGNDTIRIGDGIGEQYITKLDLPKMTAKVNLGTGADEFVMQLNLHDQVELSLSAEDGSDKILIGMLLPAIQKVREASARIDLKLGGDGNLLNVRTERFDRIDLDLLAAGGGNTVRFFGSKDINDIFVFRSPSSSCEIDLDFGGGGNLVNVDTRDFDGAALHLKALDGNNVVKHELGHSLGFRHEHTRPETAAVADIMLAGDGNTVEFKTRGYDQVDLDLDLTGNDNTVEIALLLPAVQKIREAAARIDLAVGGGSLVDVRTQDIRDVELKVRENTAASTVARPSSTGNVYTITFGGSLNTKLDLKTGAGDDRVVVDAQAADPFSFTRDGRSSGMVVDLGAGNDVANIKTQGFSDVWLDLTAGDGNDTVAVDSFYGKGVLRSTDAGRVWYNVDLGDDDDRLTIDMSGYANVNGLIAAGDGNDEIHIRHRMFAIVDRSQLKLNVQLGLGSDILVLETFNYRDFETTIDRGPAGDGRDTVVTKHMTPPRGRGSVSRIRPRLDGGQDTGDFSAMGYNTHNVQQIGDTATHEVGHWFGL